MIAESHISFQKGFIKKEALEEIAFYLVDVFEKKKDLPTIDIVLSWVTQDKKNKGNKILMALLESIGRAVWDLEVTEVEIRNSLDYYRSL
jgi:3-dehydroquinate synthase